MTIATAYFDDVAITPISDQVNTALSTSSGVIAIILYILTAVALWKVFSKAGWPGVLALVPIVNIVILVKIGGMSGWLALLYLIPIVNFIFGIVVAVRVGRGFGRGAVFSFFLLWMFAFIGYFIVGFGQDTYKKPA